MKQTDVSFYFQDEWKIRPNFTLSPGLRYENQTTIDSNFNFAPRIAFAWSPIFEENAKPAAAAGSSNSAAKPVERCTTATAPAPSCPCSCCCSCTWSTENSLQRWFRNLL